MSWIQWLVVGVLIVFLVFLFWGLIRDLFR